MGEKRADFIFVVRNLVDFGKSQFKQLGFIKILVLAILMLFLYTATYFPSKKNTVYVYYDIKPGTNKGLTVTDTRDFLLNDKPINITSGLVHYFRVHPGHWRDRLKKLRASGAIAVKTCIPWNLHEPYKDVYDFGNGSFEMSEFLDIVKFIQSAKEEDLLVILGIGPYINAELDLGGLPSYLLGEGVKIRTSDPKFLARAEAYFSHFLHILAPLQVQNGGPIIMFQVENSYGAINVPEIDTQYLVHLKKIIEDNGIKALLYTSDSVSATLDRGGLPEQGVLQTANSETDVLAQLETLAVLQPRLPAMVHLRSGCVDLWNWPNHNRWLANEYEAALTEALQFPASVCVHVFHGGTTFGFLNGATCGDTQDSYHPHTSSYDTDAPLTEAGDYTEKYEVTLKLFRAVQPFLFHPPPPPSSSRSLSLSLAPTQELLWRDIVRQLPNHMSGVASFLYMEDLPAVDGMKQSYGYVRYTIEFRAIIRHPKIKFIGRKRDIAMVLVDGWNVGPKEVIDSKRFGFWDSDDEILELPVGPGVHVLELVVENCGRLSHAPSLQWLADKKGLGPDNRMLFQFAAPMGKMNVTGLPFLGKWIDSLTGWRERVHYELKPAPSLVKATFHLTPEQITDTFLDIKDWHKGVAYVNGFNIGRYFCDSPQQTMFIPGPLLRPGENHIVFFEHYYNSYNVKLTTEPRFL